MDKGVLLELDGRKAVVLTPQGEFKKVPLPRGTWDIGDEIDFAEVRQVPWKRWGVVAAAAVVMLLSPVGVSRYLNAQPDAIVTFDINPSVQLTLNRNDVVLQAVGLNEAGIRILEGLQWQNRSVDDVVAALTDRAVVAKQLNVADEGSAVVLAVASARQNELSKERADEIRDKAWRAVTASVNEQAQVQNVTPKTNVAGLEASATEKAEAEKAGLSVGKLLLGKGVQAVRPEFKLDELKDHATAPVLKDLKLQAADVLNNVLKGHGGGTSKGQQKNGGDSTPPPLLPMLNDDGKNQPDDKGGARTDNSNNSGRDGSGHPPTAGQPSKDQHGGNGPKDDQNGDKKANDKTPGDQKSNDNKSGKQGDGTNDGGAQHDTWTVPIIGISIKKPGFLNQKPKPPSSEQSGGKAPSDKQSERQKEQDKQQQERQRAEDKKKQDSHKSGGHD